MLELLASAKGDVGAGIYVTEGGELGKAVPLSRGKGNREQEWFLFPSLDSVKELESVVLPGGRNLT